MGIKEMSAFARKIVTGNTGYDQYQRWSFFNRKTKTFIPGKEADCSSFCGAVAVMGGYPVDLSDPFFTGTFKGRLEKAGFTAIRYSSLSQLREGDFILGPTHVEYCLGDSLTSDRIDERGKITGGKAGNQNGRETRISNKYVHSKGWTWILRPPAGKSTPAPAKKSNTEIAQEVIAGKWGTGISRKDKLQQYGYSYDAVQAEVNRILAGKSSSIKKSNIEVAREVIAGKWGVGDARKKKLSAAGYSYDAVQKEVNSILGKKSTPVVSKNGSYRVTTNGARLNGRSGPGTKYRKTMTAANGYVLTIIDVKDGWGKSTGGHWYSMKYLKKV